MVTYSYMYWGTSSQLSALIKIDLGIGIEKQLAVMNACTYSRAREQKVQYFLDSHLLAVENQRCMGYTTLRRKYYSKVGSGPHKHTARRAVHSAVEVVKVGVVLQCNVNRSYSSDFLPAVVTWWGRRNPSGLLV